MSHLNNRRVIAAILAGESCADRALALVTALRLAEQGFADLAESSLTAALALPPDHRPMLAHGQNQEPCPATGAALWASFAQGVSDQPTHVGHALLLAAGLARIWSSATNEERPLLRARYLSGLHYTQAPAGSFATRAELRQATRDLPTMADEAHFSPAALQDLARISEAPVAQQLVASLLVEVERIPAVAAAIATIACRAMGTGPRAHQACDAVLAALRLRQGSGLDPSLHAVLVMQAAHQGWWATQPMGVSATFSTESSNKNPDLASAILGGQASAARRAGRAAAAEGRFWRDGTPLMLTLIDKGGIGWIRAATLIGESSAQAQPVPDVAAAIAAALAAGLGPHS